MVTMSVYVGDVNVDVDLDELTDDELIEELEGRNFFVYSEDQESFITSEFTNEELDWLRNAIDLTNPRVGSMLYQLREKLVIR